MVLLKQIPRNPQSFREIIENNQLYIDKTENILKMFNEWGRKFYYISRPWKWWKSLAIDTMKEIFLGNKELFKGLYAYDNYKDWNKSYPVVVMNFAWYSKEKNNDILNYIESKTNIFIWDKIYKINDFISWGLLDLKDLIDKLYEKTWKQVVLLFDEYDSPLTKNLDNPEDFKKIKDFFYNFYNAIKDIRIEIRFFYFSWLTKVFQNSLYSALNSLMDITFFEDNYDILWYTEKEIKKYFKDYIPSILWKLNIDEKELFQKIKFFYDGYYFWKDDDRLYNPWSINHFFIFKELKPYWSNTWIPSLIELQLSKNRKDEYLNLLDWIQKDEIGLDESDFIISEIDDSSLSSVLFQTWYLTYQKWGKNTVKIANKESYIYDYMVYYKICYEKNKLKISF